MIVHDPRFHCDTPEYAVYWAILHSSGLILPRLKVERPHFAEMVAQIAVKGLLNHGWAIERKPPPHYGPMPDW